MLGKIDYDVLCSASYDALRGLAPGWCDVVLVSQLPLIYKLSADDLGEFGEFSVRKRPGGQCEIDFRVTFTEAQPIFTEGDPVSLELLQLPTEERRRRIVELSDDEETRRRAAAAKKLAHLRQVEKLYFEILARDDVFPLPAQPTPVDLGQAGAAGLPEKAKQQGRYRLTDNEIEKRKRTVKQAQELMKESDYTKTWEQIADDLGMSDRTLRDWRHNPIYS